MLDEDDGMEFPDLLGETSGSGSYMNPDAFDDRSSATTSFPQRRRSNVYNDNPQDDNDDDDLEIRDDEMSFESSSSYAPPSVFGSDDDTMSMGAGKEALYEAYNQLHVLAQVCSV